MSDDEWIVETRADTAAALHALDAPGDGRRRVWIMQVARPALVLGSTQAISLAAQDDLDVMVRRSGGGAVIVAPTTTAWIDVLVPRGDDVWDDDVNQSFFWLGETWVRALAALGVDAAVHRGGLDRTPWSSLVCFAGLGPGEVTVDGRKAIGISQRRTRGVARFQCLVFTEGAAPISAIVDQLTEPADPAERAALRAHLDATTNGLARGAGAVVGAFLRALRPSAD